MPGTRHAIEQVATKFNIYFLFAFAMLGSVLFLVGLVQLLLSGSGGLNSVPEPVLLTVLGLLCFTLFFPWFTTLYFARHLLASVTRLERQNAEVRSEISAISSGAA